MNTENTIYESAYAKLNISLDTTARRSDGYHDMLMVMQSVSLHDDIRLSFDSSGHIRARSDMRFIPNDDRNLAVKAAMVFYKHSGIKCPGLLIEIKKRIPVGAGMGGGSSDAAAVLRALDRYYGMPLNESELECLSAEVGSDVPFCVWGGTTLACGKGEKLRPLPPMPDCRFVICKPSFSISTPELFQRLDAVPLRCHPDTDGILMALEEEQLTQICRRMYNVFEDIDDRRLRTVREIKSILLDHGALGAIMTGTGSAVYGVFESGAGLDTVCSRLKKEYGFCQTAECVSRIAP